MDEINSKELPIFDEIFGALDGVFEPDESGLEVLSRILVMPDDSFEVIKGTLMNSIESTFNAPDARIAFAQMVNQQGLRIEDLAASIDDTVAAVGDLTAEGVELSESKKDFVKFIFTTFVNTVEASNMVSHRIINIPIELCREGAKLPAYATDGSAAMDIYSPEEYVIGPGECMIISTGLKVNIPIGYALLIQPRSGLSRKTKLRVANTPGLIDSDYHEEIGVIVENIDPPIKQVGSELLNGELIDGTLYGSSFTIGKGERFAQMRLVEVPLVHWLEVDSLGTFESDHGKGFGSTGAT